MAYNNRSIGNKFNEVLKTARERIERDKKNLTCESELKIR